MTFQDSEEEREYWEMTGSAEARDLERMPADEFWYYEEQPLPFPEFEGPIRIPMWGVGDMEFEVHAYSLRLASGGRFYVFEIPKPVVEAVCRNRLHARPETEVFGVVRFGAQVGLFPQEVPIEVTQCLEENDYRNGFTSIEDAWAFLSCDVLIGTQRNDVAHQKSQQVFLW